LKRFKRLSVLLGIPIATAGLPVLLMLLLTLRSSPADWVPLGSSPGNVVQFVGIDEKSSYVKTDEPAVYRVTRTGRGSRYDEGSIPNVESSYPCDRLAPPGRVVDHIEHCDYPTHDYYVLLEDGRVWGYSENVPDDQSIAWLSARLCMFTIALAGLGVGIIIAALVHKKWSGE
jgi:hypothetical protein